MGSAQLGLSRDPATATASALVATLKQNPGSSDDQWGRLQAFYSARDGRAAWTVGAGREAARVILARMRGATADGLPDARDTAHDLAQQLGETSADAGDLVALDIRITSAFLAWARQLALGIHEPDRSARRIDVTEEFLLRNEPAWPRARIESAMTSGRRRTVLLQRPVPIHLTYFTAWEENGTVNFRADIYGLDHDDQ